MVKYKKYDIATKVSLVERYLEELKADPKHKIADFAYENGIADSTFNDWVIKYKRDRKRFINGNQDNDSVNLKPTVNPTFIEISKDRVVTPPQNPSSIKLSYKDVSLEFNANELDKVMDIIRRW